MCGIFGLFDVEGIAHQWTAVQGATDAAAHRGPDSRGFVVIGLEDGRGALRVGSLEAVGDRDLEGRCLALGHRRLEVIDRSSAADQPMASADGRLWMTYNGEVYNYRELRAELEALGCRFRSASDTEVVLQAYEVWGRACVTRFVGMWAFAIADLGTRRLFCSRDRFGIKPFHYYAAPGRVAFGSEIKQILAVPGVPRRANHLAVSEFLAYAAVESGPETFFDGILRLPAGHNLTVDLASARLELTPYYQPALHLRRDLSRGQAAEQFASLLRESVRLHLRSDVRVGSCLSGGLDSSSIVGLVSQHRDGEAAGRTQEAISCHFEDEDANERRYIDTVIRSTPVVAHIVEPTGAELLEDLGRLVWHQEEPFGSTSAFAQWCVFKRAGAEGLRVMLDGQGADELLGGYVGLAPHYFRQLHEHGRHARLVWETWRHARFQQVPWATLIPGRWGRFAQRATGTCAADPRPSPIDCLHPDVAANCRDHGRYARTFETRAFGPTDHFENALYQLTFLSNLQALLRLEDRASMAFSVEARVPFLDHRLAEFTLALPSSFKIRNGYTKRVLRDGMTGVLPEPVRWRTSKLGFSTPERRWQRTILKPLTQEAIHSKLLAPFVQPDRATHYLEWLERSQAFDWTPFRWVNAYLWMTQYGVG